MLREGALVNRKACRRYDGCAGGLDIGTPSLYLLGCSKAGRLSLVRNGGDHGHDRPRRRRRLGRGLAAPAAPGPWPALAAEIEAASASFRALGAVESPRIYGLGDLRAKPETTLAVYYNTSAGPVSATFKRVLLWTLLQEAGIRIDPAVHNDILRRSVRLTATDGYEAGFTHEIASVAESTRQRHAPVWKWTLP